MTPSQIKVNKFIQHFGRQFSLKDGVCALYDSNNQETAIIEVPDFSENVIFHCALRKLPPNASPQILRKILLLNFEISAMQGCWLAIDDNDQLCLCHTLALNKTDEQHFTDTLAGFIEQVKNVREFTQTL